MSELIQPIVLLVDRLNPADEIEGITAAAVASVHSYFSSSNTPMTVAELDRWVEWLVSSYAKTVRRADEKTFRKVVAAHKNHPDPALNASHVAVGGAEAMAFPPMLPEEFPKLLSRLQVSGTTLPRRSPTASAALRSVTDFTIMLNDDLGMTTGKAAAQAAHAAFEWHLRHRGGLFVPEVQFVPGATLMSHRQAMPGIVAIEDAGRTEIEPGSLTAIAWWAP